MSEHCREKNVLMWYWILSTAFFWGVDFPLHFFRNFAPHTVCVGNFARSRIFLYQQSHLEPRPVIERWQKNSPFFFRQLSNTSSANLVRLIYALNFFLTQLRQGIVGENRVNVVVNSFYRIFWGCWFPFAFFSQFCSAHSLRWKFREKSHFSLSTVSFRALPRDWKVKNSPFSRRQLSITSSTNLVRLIYALIFFWRNYVRALSGENVSI